MMKLKNLVFSLLSILLFASCVSLDIAPKTQSAKEVQYRNPPGFQENSMENLDASWLDRTTGNSISLKSSCFDPADPSLQDLEQSALSGLKIEKTLQRKVTEFNKREALRSETLVKIDGIRVLVEMLIFKKNNCNYLINHVGLEKNLNQTRKSFDSFLSTVVAP